MTSEIHRPRLERALGLPQAVALNVANMVGIGPFITIPLFLKEMNGPHALVAWVLAAVLVLCDGLIWSELGAALPGSGGSYHYLQETLGRYRWGRALPFLFIWQFLVSGALEMASGYLGAAKFLTYIWPQLPAPTEDVATPTLLNAAAAVAVLGMTLLLCRPIRWIGRLVLILVAGTLLTVLTVIVAGAANFQPELVTIDPAAFTWNAAFFLGLGGAMRIAIYDYLGYYNVCHLGEEIREPHRTIPRAVMISVVLVASIYLTMNLCIIGVMPWQEVIAAENNMIAVFMERLFGRPTALAFTALILWTALAGLYAMLLGYSRIPYAAALNGDFLPQFAWLHPIHRYPAVSLFSLGALTALFCFIPLKVVIDAAVTVRILVQFIAQIAALHVLRTHRPDVQLPFRMWLYPLPCALALLGWVYLLTSSEPGPLWITAGVYASGIGVYVLFRWGRA